MRRQLRWEQEIREQELGEQQVREQEPAEYELMMAEFFGRTLRLLRGVEEFRNERLEDEMFGNEVIEWFIREGARREREQHETMKQLYKLRSWAERKDRKRLECGMKERGSRGVKRKQIRMREGKKR